MGIAAYATAQTADVSGTIRTTAGVPIAGVVVTDGYTVTANKNVMNYADQFTYSESNIKAIVVTGGTKYQVYAQDFYKL